MNVNSTGTIATEVARESGRNSWMKSLGWGSSSKFKATTKAPRARTSSSTDFAKDDSNLYLNKQPYVALESPKSPKDDFTVDYTPSKTKDASKGAPTPPPTPMVVATETKATEESRDDMVLWLEEALDAHDDSPDKRIDNGETKIMNDTVEVNTENVEVPTILQDLDSAKKAYDDSFQFFKNDDARVDKESEDRFKALTIEVKEKGNFISSLIAKNKEQDLRIDGLMKLNSEKGDGIETLITKCAETEEKLSKSDQDKTLMAHQLTMMTEKYDGLSFDFKKEEEKNSILSVKLKGLEYKLFSLTGENNMLVQEKEAWVHDHLKTQEIIVQLREELYESKHEASVVVAQCSDQCFENDELIKQNDELKKLLAEAQDQLRMQREQEAIKPTVDKDGGTDSIVTEEFEVPVTFERQVVFERICSPASFVDTPVYADDEGKLSKRSGFLACIFPGMA